VHLLLPPSEAKQPDGDGPAWSSVAGDPERMLGGDGALGRVRLRVLREVATLCGRRNLRVAAAALNLPPGQVDDACARNAVVFEAPTMMALDRYAGTVYAGLNVASMSARVRAEALTSALVFSGGFGVVRGDDWVPWYRVPGSARLPKAGVIAALWRPALSAVLPEVLGAQLIVDLRSSDYAGLWRPSSAVTPRLVGVRVLQRRAGGAEQVVSYHSKLMKGRLARALIEAGPRRVRRRDDVAQVAESLGLEPRLTAAGLDLVDSSAGDIGRQAAGGH
jgi:hypothetical protein